MTGKETHKMEEKGESEVGKEKGRVGCTAPLCLGTIYLFSIEFLTWNAARQSIDVRDGAYHEKD